MSEKIQLIETRSKKKIIKPGQKKEEITKSPTEFEVIGRFKLRDSNHILDMPSILCL